MIKFVNVPKSKKLNWLDQNNVVFGFDGEKAKSVITGMSVFNLLGKRVAANPTDLPYHFSLAHQPKHVSTSEIFGKAWSDVDDVLHVELLPDNAGDPALILECYNYSHGFYYIQF